MKPFIILSAILALACGASSAAEKPNVLFIIVDDLTTTLTCMGSPSVHTPQMDALAARGVRFHHAYTQFALCNPSRCSFLAGCYPERTKVLDLVTSLRGGLPKEVTLPQHFKDHGYIAGRIGKVFHVPDPKTKLDVELGAPLHKDTALFEDAKTENDPDSAAKQQRLPLRAAHPRRGARCDAGVSRGDGLRGLAGRSCAREAEGVAP